MVIRSPPIRRLTFGHPELRKGKVPIIIRANRTLIKWDPEGKSLVKMVPPLADEDDDTVNLRSFGPTYGKISAEGDGKNSKEPLPTVTKRASSKATKTTGKAVPGPSSKEASNKRVKTKTHKKRKTQKVLQASNGEDYEADAGRVVVTSSGDETIDLDPDSSGSDVDSETHGLSTTALFEYLPDSTL